MLAQGREGREVRASGGRAGHLDARGGRGRLATGASVTCACRVRRGSR